MIPEMSFSDDFETTSLGLKGIEQIAVENGLGKDSPLHGHPQQSGKGAPCTGRIGNVDSE